MEGSPFFGPQPIHSADRERVALVTVVRQPFRPSDAFSTSVITIRRSNHGEVGETLEFLPHRIEGCRSTLIIAVVSQQLIHDSATTRQRMRIHQSASKSPKPTDTRNDTSEPSLSATCDKLRREACEL